MKTKNLKFVFLLSVLAASALGLDSGLAWTQAITAPPARAALAGTVPVPVSPEGLGFPPAAGLALGSLELAPLETVEREDPVRLAAERGAVELRPRLGDAVDRLAGALVRGTLEFSIRATMLAVGLTLGGLALIKALIGGSEGPRKKGNSR